ncbi:toxin-antitoxin system YwqK family antitoxin [Halocola ammonii]
MKSLFLTLIVIILSISAHGQNPMDQIYLDEVLQPTDSSEAVYRRILVKKSSTHIECQVFSVKSGELKMTGVYSLIDGELFENGHFTYYHSHDQIESTGHFVLGYKSGVWKRFTEDGEKLPERYYDPESAKILLRLSKVGLE